MGRYISHLLERFASQVPDTKSNATVLLLSSQPSLWSAGHAVFDELRRLRNSGNANSIREAQYFFEESCAQALYNATEPPDAFDPSSAFYVLPAAVGLARQLQFSDSQLAKLFP